MSAIFKSSKAIANMTTATGKTVVVSYVSETTAWKRTFLDQSLQNDFLAAAKKYQDTLKAETTQVAIKEAEHPVHSDAAPHYSALELDKNNNAVASKHYYK